MSTRLAVDPGPDVALRRRGPRAGVSYSPLRPRTTGASTWKRVPSGSSSDAVDDLLRRLALTSRTPCSGQCGTPMRA